MIKNRLFRSDVEVIKSDDTFLIVSNEWPINTEDEVIDLGEGTGKLIWTSERPCFIFNDGPPHDHNYDYPGGFIQPTFREDFERIVEAGGKCQIEAEIDEFGVKIGPKLAFGEGLVFYTSLL